MSETSASSKTGRPLDSQPSIAAKDLTKTFDDFMAVDHVSFSVPTGTIFAFLGPNGAGKTTTIKMLTTLLKPSSGTLAVNGHDPVTDPYAARKSFGIVFQDPSLDNDLTAYENMVFHGGLYGVPSRILRERIQILMELVELWNRRDDLVKNYSGGMKRRLEIARALLHGPKILFLDEPTLGLDPQTRSHIWGFIKTLSSEQGLTVFFSTHYMEEAERVADEIAIIDGGKIIATGKAAQLREQTRTETLEDAFIALTGHKIREEEVSARDRMRMAARAWSKR